ncbi:MAG: MFS transporter, partial [Bradyrhizobiaceae bacterium]|nr:MFS transporter [Bradyrhizobiaceae bacterium]
MRFNLLATRRFAPLFWCQFFSAFNDNFLKQALVLLILYKWHLANADGLIALASAVLIFPYFILSAIGGEVADRFDKAVIARRLKLAEIAVAAITVAGFWLDSAVLLFFALFLIGVIAALFGPIKYGILPDHLAEAELPAGNALVEGATFIAILTGSMVAGYASKNGAGPASFAGLMLVFSLACFVSALFIPRTGEAAPNLKVDCNIARSTLGLLRELRHDSRLWWGGLVVSWFWLVGAAITVLLAPLVKHALGGDEEVQNACLAIFSIAVAVGSGL